MRNQNQARQSSGAPAQGNHPRRPVHEVRFGNVKAAVWENRNQNGTWHSVSLSRSYKDGDAWRNVDSFGKDDLLLVAKAADLAHTWICEQRQSAAGTGD